MKMLRRNTKHRLAFNMAVKPSEVSIDTYDYSSITPYSGRNKDEKLDVPEYYKTRVSSLLIK